MLAELHRGRCERAARVRKAVVGDLEIVYKEKPGMALGSIVWEGSNHLCEHLVLNREMIAGRKVLELGSGAGICSLICAKLGAEVTCTDKEELLELIKENVEMNRAKLKVQSYLWGEGSLGIFDIVIGSDIVYYGHEYNQLLSALTHNTCAGSLFILSYTHRHDSEESFFSALLQWFKLISSTECSTYKILTYLRI